MCTVLMCRTLCEKLIDTATLFCTHSLDYLSENHHRIILVLLKWNGTYTMCRSYWILLATKRHDMFMIIGNEIYGVLRSGAFAFFMFGCACA